MDAFSAHRSVHLLLSERAEMKRGGWGTGGQSDSIQCVVFHSLLKQFYLRFCTLFVCFFVWRRLGVLSHARVRVTSRKAGALRAWPASERSQSQIYQRVNCRVRRYGARGTLRDVAPSDWERKLGSGAKIKETKRRSPRPRRLVPYAPGRARRRCDSEGPLFFQIASP